MKTYKPTMSHNVCYRKVTRFAGKDIFAWNVHEGMLVYDSDLQLFGLVQNVFGFDTIHPTLRPCVYVRFRNRKGFPLCASYTPEWANKILFVVDKDCYVICRNGYLVYGSRCYNSLFADAVDCVVTKIDTKHNQVFIRPVVDGSFGLWVSASDVVCNHLVGVKNEKEDNHRNS